MNMKNTETEATIDIDEAISAAQRTSSRLWAVLAQKGVRHLAENFQPMYEEIILTYLLDDTQEGSLALKKTAIESELERINVYISEALRKDIENKVREDKRVVINEHEIGESFMRSVKKRVERSKNIFMKVYVSTGNKSMRP